MEKEMDIYSPKGTKIVYTGKGGYDSDKKHADKYLKIGNVYTVNYTEVNNWNTDVYLEEIEGISFNSVHFIKHD